MDNQNGPKRNLIKKSLFQSLIFTLLFSCQPSNNSAFDFVNDQEFIYDLKSQKKHISQILSPEKIYLKNDFLIVTEDNQIPFDKPLIHIINVDNLTFNRSKGVNGMGPNEITDAFLYDTGFSDSTFWINSTRSKRMAEFSLYDSSLLSISEFVQPEAMLTAYYMQMITDSTYLAVVANDDSKYVEFNQYGNRITSYGRLESVPNYPNLTTFMRFSVNVGLFKVDRQSNKFVKIGMYRDYVEIFDYKTKEFSRLEGPRLEIPDFQIAGSGAAQMAVFPMETKYGHRDIAFGEKYMYDLYGGFSEADFRKTSRLAETVYVLSKEGKVIAKLNLDISVRSIVVDENRGKIYAITTDEEPGIATFDIPQELFFNQQLN